MILLIKGSETRKNNKTHTLVMMKVGLWLWILWLLKALSPFLGNHPKVRGKWEEKKTNSIFSEMIQIRKKMWEEENLRNQSWKCLQKHISWRQWCALKCKSHIPVIRDGCNNWGEQKPSCPQIGSKKPTGELYLQKVDCLYSSRGKENLLL